jgi:hypothetical protein
MDQMIRAISLQEAQKFLNIFRKFVIEKDIPSAIDGTKVPCGAITPEVPIWHGSRVCYQESHKNGCSCYCIVFGWV